ncbi:MAG: hypothetical protein HY650_08230 [Acidobacteria bacterium]|nr:hypothetical protein [Acidobacteriota bacterium]
MKPSNLGWLLALSLLTGCAGKTSSEAGGPDGTTVGVATSGNVLVLQTPVKETESAIAEARRLLEEKKYQEAGAALERAERLNLRVEHYHLVLMGVRMHLAHGLQVLREKQNSSSRVQLEKARKLISEHLEHNSPGAREFLLDLDRQIDGLISAVDQSGRETRSDFKRLIQFVEQSARNHP